jgi:hypothetical protein
MPSTSITSPTRGRATGERMPVAALTSMLLAMAHWLLERVSDDEY